MEAQGQALMSIWITFRLPRRDRSRRPITPRAQRRVGTWHPMAFDHSNAGMIRKWPIMLIPNPLSTCESPSQAIGMLDDQGQPTTNI